MLTTPESNRANKLGSLKAYFVCFASALFFFYEFIQMQMFNAINDPLREAFNTSATDLSFLSSTYLWGDLLLLLPAGVLLDRYSTRKVIIYAMLMCIVSTFGFAMTSDIRVAGFWHFLAGTGNAFCFLACVILVARWFPSNKQAMIIGLVITIALLGGMSAQAPLATMAAKFGWRKALWLVGLFGMFLLMIIIKYVEDTPSSYIYSNPNAKTSVWGELKQVVRNKQNHFVGVYTALLNLPIMVLCALWGSPAIQALHGVTAMQASTVISMIFVGSIIGCPLAGWISDNMGLRRKPMILGAVLSLLAISALMVNHQLSFATLVVLFFCLGFFTSTQVIAYPVVAESNSHKLTATATGLASLIIMGGGAVGQLVFGELLDWHWQGTLLNNSRTYVAADYHFAMMMFPCSFLVV